MNIQRIEPNPGQESVWDYPRPPRLEDTTKHIQIIFNDVTIVDTHSPKRVLETSHPPGYYIPPADIKMEYLLLTPRSSFCEWKGSAGYYSIRVGDKEAQNAAWFYPNPTPEFASLQNHVAFYAHLMDACYVDGEKCNPNQVTFMVVGLPAILLDPLKVVSVLGDGKLPYQPKPLVETSVSYSFPNSALSAVG